MGNKHETNARAAWGDAAPVWVMALAAAVDQTSLSRVAARIGRAAGAISQTINRKYPGDLSGVEQAVRAALLAEEVDCPIIGRLPAADCMAHQRAPFSTASPTAVRLHRACPGCPNNAGRRSGQGGSP